MWGQRIWAPQPTSNNKLKGPAEGENVWGWLRPTATRRNRWGTSCSRQLVSWEERTICHPPQPSPSSPNKGTSVEGQLWEHDERTIVEEPVTSALNARSWLSGLMKEWPLNSAMLPTATHSKWRETLDGTDTQVVTCAIDKWTAKMKGAEEYI